MKFLKLLPILVVGFMFLFLNCGDDESSPITFQDSKISTTLKIQITDNRSNIPLDSVLVKILDRDSTYTSLNGMAKFSNVVTGVYVIVCEKVGYESISFSVNIAFANSDVPILPEITATGTMAKKGVILSGSIYYDLQASRGLVLADSAIVECIFPNNSSIKTKYRSTFALLGAFSFPDLPEHVQYTLRVKPYTKNGKVYVTNTNISIPDNGNITVGESVILSPINLNENTQNFQILEHNLDTLKATDTAVVVFSEPVNVALLTPDSIYVRAYISSNNIKKILVKSMWYPAISPTTLKIIPYEGNWDITQNNYRLYIKNIKSSTGKILKKVTPWNLTNHYYSFTPEVNGSLVNAAFFKYSIGGDTLQKIDYNESSIQIFWPPIANAQSYEIYKKQSSDLQWLLYTNTTIVDTVYTITTTNWFNNGDSATLLVIGVNSDSASPFETAPRLVLKDTKKPFLNLTVSASPSGFDNTGGTSASTITFSSITFPEPMDTTKKPAIVNYETGGTADLVPVTNCSWLWETDAVKGKLQVIVDPAKNYGGDSITINFKTLTDMAGNLFDSTGTGLGIKSYTTTP